MTQGRRQTQEGGEGEIVAGPRRSMTIYPNIFAPSEGKGKGAVGSGGQVRSSHSSHSSHSTYVYLPFLGHYTVFIYRMRVTVENSDFESDGRILITHRTDYAGGGR